MTIIDRIKGFLAQEDGAVTVDFIVLTSGLVVAGVFSFGGFSAVTMELANQTSAFLSSGALLDLIH